MKESYDFIMAGGGLSGLSLACRLNHSPLRNRSILIVDQDAKEHNDRTFSFWTRKTSLFDAAVCHTWRQLHVAGAGHEQTLGLGDFTYQTIRGRDFYEMARQDLPNHPNIEFIQGHISAIEDGDNWARVSITGAPMTTATGSWVFDSTAPSRQAIDCERYTRLKLTFRGWEVETDEPAFDPQTATFMDFRTPQAGDMRFFYVLPFAANQALVEYTLFTSKRTSRSEEDQAIADYLSQVRGVHDYRIIAQEGGCLPITDAPFPRRLGQRVMAIGVKGGRIKPSTGYAFTRVQRDSAAIVESLETYGHPFAVPAGSPGFRWLDAVMLRVMRDHGEAIGPAFVAMFQRNPIERILRFLDEATSPWEDVQLVASLPASLFIPSAWRLAALAWQRQVGQWHKSLPLLRAASAEK